METIWYKNLDWSMIWVCLIAVAVHVIYLKRKGVKITIIDVLFYLLSSILVLSFISEIAGWFLSQYTSISVDIQDSINHVLAAISGLGGGYITTSLIKRIQKKSKE